MKCSYPILMRNKKTQRLFKVPCGTCFACRMNKSKMWAIRVAHEWRCHDDSCFVTLTYNDDFLPDRNSLRKDDFQKWMKRIREYVKPQKLRYFACGEYGGKTGRPHYHAIIFNFREEDRPLLEKSWTSGFVTIDEVNLARCNYITGYVLKKQLGKKGKEFYEEVGIEPEFVLMSRRPGIGMNFLEKFEEYFSKHAYIQEKGHKYPLPRYYEEKLFPDKTGFHYLEKSRKMLEVEKKRIDKLLERGYNIRTVDALLGEQQERNLKTLLSMKGKLK